jgi:hypothetical protein
MVERVVIVDWMLSGTGLRDGVAGGYLKPSEIGISSDLAKRLLNWVAEYEDAHYYQFNDEKKNERLDQEGIAIARRIEKELSDVLVEYFSTARMKKIAIWPPSVK